jgi:hypothetical protein
MKLPPGSVDRINETPCTYVIDVDVAEFDAPALLSHVR